MSRSPSGNSTCPRAEFDHRVPERDDRLDLGVQLLRHAIGSRVPESRRAGDIPRTDALGEDELLNRTVAVDEDAYVVNDNIYRVIFEDAEALYSTMALVVFAS